MEYVIDLDQAAAVVAERMARWLAAGLKVGQMTWRDETAPWPQRCETDRTLVRDPDSVGVLISGPADAELSVVLFRGGWAAGPGCLTGLPGALLMGRREQDGALRQGRRRSTRTGDAGMDLTARSGVGIG
ncbi:MULTISPECIES: hypothetical protein [unclassified Streptomyces]|uniref:hypothetical protein n=1 Tax=unclassified Streptomyces TaxID=2593676 RepID=UPI0011612E22|nr:hypothetical protein [Streptomyces sp. TSRI0281]